MTLSNEQFERFIYALMQISQGDTHGPAGLEGVGIALAGGGLKRSVGKALSEIASSIEQSAALQFDALCSIGHALEANAAATDRMADAILRLTGGSK